MGTQAASGESREQKHLLSSSSPRAASIVVSNEFQRFALDMVTSLVQFDEAVFYVLDPDARRCGYEVRNMDPGTVHAYRHEYEKCDPLSAANASRRDRSISTLLTEMSFTTLRATRYYEGFLQARGYHDSAVLYFRCGGQIRALVGVLRKQAKPRFSPPEIQLLAKVCPFISYSLERECRQSLRPEIPSLEGSLTSREAEIATLLAEGLTNKRIALRVGIEPSTVKTHVLRIFEKAGVSTRSEFAARYSHRSYEP